MIDDSIIQLLEASKTVDIYVRNMDADPADVVRRGHFDCNCVAVPPMSGNRSYLTTKMKFMARDGCGLVVGFVWSPDDQAWRNAAPHSLERRILERTGMLWEMDATHPIAQQILGGDSIYVRLVDYMDGELEHVNERVSFDAVVDEFSGGDPGHEIDAIQIATTTPGRLPVGSYLDPSAISMGQTLSWLDGARLGARAYAATPNAARRLERAGLLAGKMTNKLVKLEVGAPPRERDVADAIENAIRRHGRAAFNNFADRYAMAVTAIYDPDLDYDEDDDV